MSRLTLTASIAICAAFVALPCLGGESGPERRERPLVPAPRFCSPRDGVALLSPRWTLVVEDTAADLHAAEILAAELAARFGWRPRLATKVVAGPAIILSTRPVRAGAFPRQAYGLSIQPQRILVSASTPQGRFYGVQTLRQLVRSSAGPSLPCVEIVDWPAMAWRGVSDDVSRGQMSTLRDFRELMGTLAYYKINLYAIYLEDVLTDRPDSSRGLTLRDLAELAAEARRSHITLLPIYQTMGSNARIMRELKQQGPTWLWSHLPRSTPPSPFSPWATRAIVRDVDAIATAVPTPWFHLGGDEVGNFGLDQPRTYGVAADGATHGAYVRFLSEHLRRVYGRRAFVYSDYLLKFPNLLAELDRSTAIVDWNYHPGQTYATTRRFIDAGFRNVYVSPGLWSWNAFYPNYERGLANTRAFIDTGKAVGAVGAITSAWGDNGSVCLRENNRLGYAYGAAVAWQKDSPEIESFFGDFARVEYGTQGSGLARASRLVGLRSLTGIDYVGRVVHRIPRVRRLGPAWRDQMVALRSDMEEALRLIEAEAPQARHGRDHLRALNHAAKWFLYLADRELAMDLNATRLEMADPHAQEQAASDLESLEHRVRGLAVEYAALWLARNKRDALDGNLAKLGHEANELRALGLAAKAGRLTVWSPGQRPVNEVAKATEEP
jgi:hypothetical protein